MLDGEDEEESVMEQQVADRVVARRRVRVWFGEHVVADYTATPDLAASYAKAMARRFAGLRVTSDPVPDSTDGRPLPPELLWGNDPH